MHVKKKKYSRNEFIIPLYKKGNWKSNLKINLRPPLVYYYKIVIKFTEILFNWLIIPERKKYYVPKKKKKKRINQNRSSLSRHFAN